jgi:hypothetical protein
MLLGASVIHVIVLRHSGPPSRPVRLLDVMVFRGAHNVPGEPRESFERRTQTGWLGIVNRRT